MSSGNFLRGTSFTFASNVLSLFIGLGTSVILARALGPEGKGVYALAALLPSLIVTFGNLGIGPATAYYVAKGEYRRQEILGSNMLLCLIISIVGIAVGFVLIIAFRQEIFPDVAKGYLYLALALIPLEILFISSRYVILGAQRIVQYNYVHIVHMVLFFGTTAIALLALKAGVIGALIGAIITLLAVNGLTFFLAKDCADGISLVPNTSYIKHAAKYGLQVHVMNILGFLNYRIDMLFISAFLGPAAVGLYSIGVGLIEKLWMVSYSASTVLFPRVAAETDEKKKKEFTPLIARSVLWLTAFGALVLVFLSHYIVLVLFAEEFLPAVGALQALLIGTIALSAGRVLSNDIAGRGRPGLNIYTGIAAVAINVVLNLLWIPKYGIVGAGWASTVSYSVSFLGSLFFYCRLSGNRWTRVISPQRGDWTIYRRAITELGKAILRKLKGSSKIKE